MFVTPHLRIVNHVVTSHTNSCIYIYIYTPNSSPTNSSAHLVLFRCLKTDEQKRPTCFSLRGSPPPLLAELSMAEYDISPISTDTNCHVQSLPRRPGCAVMFLFSLRTWERHTSFCPRPYYHVDSSPSLRPSTRRNAVHERSHVSFHVFANGNICKNLEAGGGGAVCLFRPAGLNNT
jgi:hypothetical protein